MTPEDILKQEPIVLKQEQRALFFEQGFVAINGLVGEDWLNRIKSRSDEFIDRSRQFSVSNKEYDLSPEHTPDKPYVRRLRAPVDRHPEFWEFACNSVFTEVAADLVARRAHEPDHPLAQTWRQRDQHCGDHCGHDEDRGHRAQRLLPGCIRQRLSRAAG